MSTPPSHLFPVNDRHDTFGTIPRGVKRRYRAQDAFLMRKGLSPIVDPAASRSDFSGFAAFARDYYSNPAARQGWGTPSLNEGTEYNLVRLTFDYWLMVTLYRNHWIVRRVVDGPAQDMVRAWPRLTSEIAPKDLKRIDKAIRETNTKTQMLEALRWGRLFGGAGALIVIDGHENRLDEPLDLDTVELGSYRGLIPFDRWAGIYPDSTVSSDIRKPREFNLPQFYNIQTPASPRQFKVHASRILRFNGPPVPYPEYQANQCWGISVIEPLYEELRKRDNLSWNILSISFRANILGIQFDELAQYLSGAGATMNALQGFEQRMQAMTHYMSNNSLLMLPKDSQLQSVSQNMSGWGEVYSQFQMDIAGAAESTVTRLFGRTVSGLAQGNEQDERLYEEKIALEQDVNLRPQLTPLYQVICMSELGEIPEDLDLVFPSVRVLDDKEKAELATSVSTTVSTYFNAGIITKVQALKEIKQNATATGIGTNITDEDIAKAEKEEDMAGELAAAQKQAMLEGGEEQTPGLEAGEEEEAAASAEEEFGHRKEAGKPKQLAARDFAFARDTHSPFKGKITYRRFAGILCAVEYPAGVRRLLKNDDGDVVYNRVMEHDYGFIRDTVGMDGDEIDVILGPNPASGIVFVYAMIDMGPDLDKRENEDKVLLGFDDEYSALMGFLSMYTPDFIGSFEEMTIERFIDLYNIPDARDVETADAMDSLRESESKLGIHQFTAGLSKWRANRRDQKLLSAGRSTDSAKSPVYNTGVKLTKVSKRTFSGDPVETKKKLSKLETADLGEHIALQYLQERGMSDARPLGVTGLLIQGSSAIEVKTGLVSNGKAAQYWRETAGQPGPIETAWLKTASPKAKAKWNEKRAAEVLARKTAAIAELSAELGRQVTASTITAIVNPDSRTVDLYRFEGLQPRIQWASAQAKKGYIGTFRY